MKISLLNFYPWTVTFTRTELFINYLEQDIRVTMAANLFGTLPQSTRVRPIVSGYGYIKHRYLYGERYTGSLESNYRKGFLRLEPQDTNGATMKRNKTDRPEVHRETKPLGNW